MAKFRGNIGFVRTIETVPGVYSEVAEQRLYSGDVLRNYVRWENGERVNDNIGVTNQISIVCDTFVNQNLAFMRYIEWMGSLWKISSVEMRYPRCIINLGGVYNVT